MEKQASGSVSPGAAREHLLLAERAHDASVRRASFPAALIPALSFLSGALTLAPAGPGDVVTVIAVVWLVAELVRLSARNQWRPLRSLPRPRWNLAEAALICLAVLIGGLVGPHLLASRSNSALASWGFAAGVTGAVAASLFAANASYLRRTARAWRR